MIYLVPIPNLEYVNRRNIQKNKEIVQTQLPSHDSKLPKHYQLKAQMLLDDIVAKSLEIVQLTSEAAPTNDDDEGAVRLFKNAPRGIIFDHKEEQAPRKRPRILPGKEINEKSKKFKEQIKSVAVDGNDVTSEARYRCQRALSRLEAKEAATKEAAKREEERVAELKKVRGEKWLPSVTKERIDEAAKREQEKIARLKKVGGEKGIPPMAREMQSKGKPKQ